VNTTFLSDSNEAVIALGFLALLVAGIEIGFNLGRRSKSRLTDKVRSDVSTMSATLLGLLGLLLGFTISMAVFRYETRTQLVQEEANAIGTAYLRTQVLPDEDRDAFAGLLSAYVDSRLHYAGLSKDPEEIRTAREECLRLNGEIWARAANYAKKDLQMVPSGLFLQTLNDAIDLESTRWMSFNNRVPETVIYLNGLVALLAVNMLGYSLGLGGHRHLYSTCLLAVAIAVVMVVSIDLDRPRQGLVHVSQQPMIELQKQLRAPARP